MELQCQKSAQLIKQQSYQRNKLFLVSNSRKQGQSHEKKVLSVKRNKQKKSLLQFSLRRQISSKSHSSSETQSAHFPMVENFMWSSELHHQLAISYLLWLLGWRGRHIDQNVSKASIGKRCLSGISTLCPFHQMEGEVRSKWSCLPDHHFTAINKYILLHR